MGKNSKTDFIGVIGIISLAFFFFVFSGCMESPAKESIDMTMPESIDTQYVGSSPATQSHNPEIIPENFNISIKNGSIGLTIHSITKTMKIKDREPNSGYTFVVINLTIENLDTTTPFIVNETTIDITGGGPITQKLYSKLSNPFYWGSIPPRSNKTGEIVFGVKTTTEQFTLTLLNGEGNTILTEPLGSISYPSTKKLDITIHSAQKTTKIPGNNPLPGNIFLVVNMTIENLDETNALVVDEYSIDITDGGPITEKMYDKLVNPLFWGSIPPGSNKTGEVVFGVKGSTEQFMLMLLDGKGQVLLTEPVGPVSTGPYLSSVGDDLPNSTNFS
jgi:hypothetical protein